MTGPHDLPIESGEGAPGGAEDGADQMEATITWTGERDLLPGHRYRMAIGATTLYATVAAPKHRIDAQTHARLAARTLRQHDVGTCNLVLERAIAFEAYETNPQAGQFTLLDPLSDSPVATGRVHFALRRARNIPWQPIEIGKREHAAQKSQRPCVVWFTGLSGAGKSTIADAVQTRLHGLGCHTYLLDGDNVRHGLSKDLGFTAADRVENMRRVGEVARLMVDAGLIVLVSMISPFRAERQIARRLVEEREFCEVFVDAPLDIAESRDRKGLYAKARRGELPNFTGIDSPYEPPEDPELRIDTTQTSVDEAADLVVSALRAQRAIR